MMRMWILMLMPLLGVAQLPSSGALSIGDIRAEIGTVSGSLDNLGSNAGFSRPIAISDFYGYNHAGGSIQVINASETVDPAGETWTVTVTASGPWTLAENQSWITTNKTGASGNTTVNITATANNTGSARNYTIVFTVTGTTATATHTLYQASQ